MNNSEIHNRSFVKTVLIYCEGQTEYNYFDGFRSKSNLSFTLKPIDVCGGGYQAMLTEIKKGQSQGIIARVVLLDFDRFHSIKGEQKVFDELCQYIDNQNTRGLPILLIVSNPDFDDFVLMHCKNYQQNKIKMLPVVGYKNISELKADSKIFEKFNNYKTRSYAFALNRLNRSFPIVNSISFVVKQQTVKCKLIKQPQFYHIKTSNISDLYNLIKLLLN